MQRNGFSVAKREGESSTQQKPHCTLLWHVKEREGERELDGDEHLRGDAAYWDLGDSYLGSFLCEALLSKEG